ncbi:MAG TPA: DUF2203 domain-containing protein [Blastocatellia bacterium]|nr:DUF2203 domain-containing protein [Blastocatellia bacterium]
MLDTHDNRTFTVDEARGLIPKLRKLLARVISEREHLIDMRVEIDKAREKAAEGGGGTLSGPGYLKHLSAFSDAISQIESTGVIVKDFRNGLVDFPHEHEGRIVYLCWKPDEDRLEWWHEVDTGFAGRHRLGDDFE